MLISNALQIFLADLNSQCDTYSVFIFHPLPFEIKLLWCNKFQNLFLITLQIYSAIINSAMDTVS
jgi:hypothetical protein